MERFKKQKLDPDDYRGIILAARITKLVIASIEILGAIAFYAYVFQHI